MEPLLELSDVVKEFSSRPPVRPLDGLSMVVPPSTMIAVTGVSGKGKSTLLNVMGGLLRPEAGSVRYRKIDLTQATAAQIDDIHRRGIGFVFQTPYLFQALTALPAGQKRRLVLGRALLSHHDVLLADEPTNDLDAEWSERVFELLRGFCATEGRSVVLVTHDRSYAAQADKVYLLEGGKLREEVTL